MILDFPGGARPTERTRFGKQNINVIASCSAVCLKAELNAEACLPVGQEVFRGSLIGTSGDMPVYASIAGVFRGILEIEGNRYFVVMNNGQSGEERIFSPETRSITSMTTDDIIESAKKFAIVDSRSGIPLWRMLESAKRGCRRLVIDCTESDPLSAINYRLCLERTKSLVGGAKLLLRATNALKCVFASEYYRKAAFEALRELADDEKIFALAELVEKYPYGDAALMYALYLNEIKRDETALDYGVFIVAPETAVALYEAMLRGMPQLDRFITLCGDGIKNGGNMRVPRGITLHDMIEICGGLEDGHILIENSRLSGSPISGALSDGTRALVSAKPVKRVRVACISCGRCAEVCPVKLLPSEILASDGRDILQRCISCGTCEYICPSNIPLLGLIKKASKRKEEA